VVRRAVCAAAFILSPSFLLLGCSDDDVTVTTTTTPIVGADCAVREPTLRVDLIDEAVAAVEAELGTPQQYFEINATDLLVNVFVALDDATKVQAFVYLQGELNSQAPQQAQGSTFAAEAVDIDPQRVTSCVTDELPASTASAFEIIAGPDGTPTYSLVVDSAAGGQLIVAVDGEGRVLSVDPV
jgi:hypothetical protein